MSDRDKTGKGEADDRAGAPTDANETAADDNADAPPRPSPFGDVEGLDSSAAEAGSVPGEMRHEEDERHQEPKTGEAVARPRAKTAKWVVALVVLLAVFLAGVVTWPFAAQRLSAYLPAGLVFGGVMADRLEGLESRVTQLEATDRELAAGLDDLKAFRRETATTLAGLEDRIGAKFSADSTARLDAMAQRVGALEAGSTDTGDLAATVSSLELRLAALESGLAAKGEGSAGSTAAVAVALERISALKAALDRSRAAVEALDWRLATAEKSAVRRDRDLSAQGERIAALEEKVSATRQGGVKGVAFMLAVGQLGEVAKGPGPFETELTTIERIVGAGAGADVMKAIADLRNYAGGGVPTVALLRGRFAQTAKRILQVSSRGKGDDWLSRTLARVENLVTVRRVGDVPGSGADAIVARAEQRLIEGDVGSAVQELDRLGEDERRAADTWLRAARSRLAVDRAVAVLRAAAVAGLAG